MDIIDQFCEKDKFCEKHKIAPNSESDEILKSYINEVNEILKGNICSEGYNHPILNKYAAFYYKYEKEDVINAEKYCLYGVEQNDSSCMYNLALLYQCQKRYDLAEKYYEMRINHPNEINKAFAINNLGFIYHIHHKDDNTALKYYKMGVIEKCKAHLSRESIKKSLTAIRIISKDEEFYRNILLEILGEVDHEFKYLFKESSQNSPNDHIR